MRDMYGEGEKRHEQYWDLEHGHNRIGETQEPIEKAAFSPDAPKNDAKQSIKDQGYDDVNIGLEHVGKELDLISKFYHTRFQREVTYLPDGMSPPAGAVVLTGTRGAKYYYIPDKDDGTKQPERQAVANVPEVQAQQAPSEQMQPDADFPFSDEELRARTDADWKKDEEKRKATDETIAQKEAAYEAARKETGVEKHPHANSTYTEPAHRSIGRGHKYVLARKENIWFSIGDNDVYRFDYHTGKMYDYLSIEQIGGKYPKPEIRIYPLKNKIVEYADDSLKSIMKEIPFKSLDELKKIIEGRYEIRMTDYASKEIEDNCDQVIKSGSTINKFVKFSDAEKNEFSEVYKNLALSEETAAHGNDGGEYLKKALSWFESAPKDKVFKALQFITNFVSKTDYDYTTKKLSVVEITDDLEKRSNRDNGYTHPSLTSRLEQYLDKKDALKFIDWLFDDENSLKYSGYNASIDPGQRAKEIFEFYPDAKVRRDAYAKMQKEYPKYAGSPYGSCFLPKDYKLARKKFIADWLLMEGTAESIWASASVDKMFNGKDSTVYYWDSLRPEYRSSTCPRILKDPDERYLSTMKQLYNETQDYFKKKGVSEVTLYRGVRGSVTTSSPLESWTTLEGNAAQFSGNHGSVFKVTVPINRVFMSYKSQEDVWQPNKELKGKNEYVLIGVKDGKSLFEEFPVTTTRTGYVPRQRNR